jgi:hypothetical protein
MDPTAKDKLIADHLALVRALIKRVENKSRDEIVLGNLDRLRQRINIAIRAMPESVITQMSPFMISYQEEILSRNETFFLSCNAKEEYVKKTQKKPTAEDEFIFALTDTVRGFYKTSPKAEQDAIYQDVVKLFNACVAWMVITTKK